MYAGPNAVQTPQEVYEQLSAEGYRVRYYRVPLTDGATPKVQYILNCDVIATPLICLAKRCHDGLQPSRTIVHGHRHPMQERDFDEFARHIRAAAPSDPLIFNCQLGGGRTTTGTIIGCLVRSFATDGNTATQSTNGTEASAGSQGPEEGVRCLQTGQPLVRQGIC